MMLKQGNFGHWDRRDAVLISEVYDMGRTKGRTLWSNYSCPQTDVMGIGCGLKS